MCVSVIFAVPAKIILSREEAYVVPNQSGIIVDLCLRGREILLFAAAVLLVLFWLGERIFPDRPQPSALVSSKRLLAIPILCGLYLLFAVLSSVLGSNSQVGFWGIATENEGIAAVLGCVILYLASIEYFRTDRAIKALDRAVMIMSAAIDLMFIAERTAGPLIELFYGISDYRSGTALLFGNSANCGVVCALLAVAELGFAFGELNKAMGCIKAVLCGGLILTTISTYSSSSVYGLAAALVFVVVLLIVKKAGSPIKKLTILLAVISPLALFFVLDMQSALKYIESDIGNKGTYSAESSFGLTDISMTGSEIVLTNSECSLHINVEEDGMFVFRRENGEEIQRSCGGTLNFDPPYSPVSVEISDELLAISLGYDTPVYFEAVDGIFQYVGLNGYLEPVLSQSAFPDMSGFYKFGTGRGYIWLNSIPFLKDCVIFGHGAGTFGFYFPQNDVVGMLATHGTTLLFTDKPHCMYLGIALSYGIPALLIFLSIAFISLKAGISSYFKFADPVTAGLLGSVVCFLIIGIANDSSPVYSPIFWIFAGILTGKALTAVHKSVALQNSSASGKRKQQLIEIRHK